MRRQGPSRPEEARLVGPEAMCHCESATQPCTGWGLRAGVGAEGWCGVFPFEKHLKNPAGG